MKGLDALIRLHRWRLDEQLKRLADLMALADNMRGQIDDIDESLKSEAELSRQSVDATRAFNTFMTAELERRARLEQTIAELDREIAEMNDQVADAFSELKTYEITRENRENRRKLRARRREQAVLDEVGGNISRAGRPT